MGQLWCVVLSAVACSRPTPPFGRGGHRCVRTQTDDTCISKSFTRFFDDVPPAPSETSRGLQFVARVLAPASLYNTIFICFHGSRI